MDYNLSGRRQPSNSTVEFRCALPEQDKSTACRPACRFKGSERFIEKDNAAMYLKELWPDASVAFTLIFRVTNPPEYGHFQKSKITKLALNTMSLVRRPLQSAV